MLFNMDSTSGMVFALAFVKPMSVSITNMQAKVHAMTLRVFVLVCMSPHPLFV